jgi:hypothetical protein
MYFYGVLRKMFEEFDMNRQPFQAGSGGLSSDLLEDEDAAEKENGFVVIADFNPGIILYFLLNELLFLARGELTAIRNIDRLLQFINQTGDKNEHIRIDTIGKSIESLKQKVEKILDEQTPDIGCNENGFYSFRQILNHLIHGNTGIFCRQYAQSSHQQIVRNIIRIFYLGARLRLSSTDDLPLATIKHNGTSHELAANYLANKDHYN